MVGAAIKGLSKILRKTGKKPVRRSKKYEEALKKRPRGTPTKAGLVHKRNLLRGDEPATKKDTYLSRRATLAGVKAPKKPGYKTGLVQGVLGTAGTAAILNKLKAKKEAKAAEKDKLKKATEKHKKKTKEKRKKYGKHHG